MLVIWKSGATETIDRWQEKLNYSEALWRYASVRPFLPVAERPVRWTDQSDISLALSACKSPLVNGEGQKGHIRIHSRGRPLRFLHNSATHTDSRPQNSSERSRSE